MRNLGGPGREITTIYKDCVCVCVFKYTQVSGRRKFTVPGLKAGGQEVSWKVRFELVSDERVRLTKWRSSVEKPRVQKSCRGPMCKPACWSDLMRMKSRNRRSPSVEIPRSLDKEAFLSAVESL